jgi:hypothetical protein
LEEKSEAAFVLQDGQIAILLLNTVYMVGIRFKRAARQH